jgi:UDP-3-O-[3-hydroxymyristoyl] N-acetylglucosamine deacetylase/3-hydroxyacyl-[acyl-carrier-protein] dehydratase
MKQKTIAREVSITGIGLHSGETVTIVLKPAAVDAGISFVRKDLAGAPEIPVGTGSLQEKAGSRRCNSIGKAPAVVQTVEHLLAALFGTGITNLTIDIDGVEVPGLDGSSAGFVEAIKSAGVVEQSRDIERIVLREPVVVEEGGARIEAVPADSFKVTYVLEYEHPLLKGSIQASVTGDYFLEELSRARTFCLESEIDALKRMGFGKGATHDNTLVVGADGVIGNKVRYADEFVRHKVLDLIGDLYILGKPLNAHITAVKSGHSLNIKLVKKIMQQLNSGGNMQFKAPLDVNDIMKILPHREPFLFVDRITELDPGKRIVGLKNVTINDYFFRGHFPGKPIMPGVIMIEAMAQVGGVMMLALPENQGKIAYFMMINNVKFRKTVVPGDQLVFEVTAGKMKSKTGQVFGKAMVDGKVVVEAEMMFAIDSSQ